MSMKIIKATNFGQQEKAVVRDMQEVMSEFTHFSEKKRSTGSCKRFSSCSISERILYTSFLLAIAIGYLVALAYMYYTCESFDGKAGFSIEDVVVKYHGSNVHSRLDTAINGIMEHNLKNKGEKDVILKWIYNGTTEQEYDDHISPILKQDCIFCHTPTINPSLPDLTHYKTVVELTNSGGTPLPTLLRIAHIHLFGISFILVFIGKIFLFCDMNVVVKRIMVALPFAAVVLDVVSWFITISLPGFAYVIVASGALMGFSIGMQILVSIYQMWFYSRNKVVRNK